MREAIVVGGGPAGASLAMRLAQAGRDVVLVEREAGPTDKVCGEFLSHEAAFYLAGLGLDLPALGAVPIEAVRLIVGGRIATARLPFAAVSLSRRVLDEALLRRAAERGVTIRRGVRVQSLAPSGGGWAARCADGTAIEASAAFLATGKHDLHGWKRPRGVQGDLVAFKHHFTLSPEQSARLAGHVELVLFRGGYAGLQPVEGGRANLCLLVRRQRLAEVGRWDDLSAAIRAESPHLDARLSGASPSASRPLSLAAIPYGHVHRPRGTGADAVWRLGDQAAVIPSFSGDGMSIALHSGRLAAEAYLGGGNADRFQRLLARDVTAQVMLATGLSLGLVRRPAQLAFGAAARLLPGLMTAVAGRTRVPASALARARLHGSA
jgi:flavin-dependent dehydrogenase